MKPEVGMGATKQLGSDSYAYTIVEVVTPTKIIVQRDIARPTRQREIGERVPMEYTTNPKAEREVYTLRKNGRWCKMGSEMHNTGALTLGEREEWRDPSY